MITHLKPLATFLITALAAGSLSACGPAQKSASPQPSAADHTQAPAQPSSFGRVISFSPALNAVLDPSAPIEKLAGGFSWSEGPAWDTRRGRLYFSDVPENIVYSWSEAKGLETFLDPSGIDPQSLPQSVREQRGDMGVNGMLMSRSGELILANHGAQAVETLNLETMTRTTRVSQRRGIPFNSPNDITEASNGDIYFTDPPYGLRDQDASALPKQAVNGVYRLTPSGTLSLIDDQLGRPNGAALSPDEAYLYVTNSDPKFAVIMRYRALAGGGFGEGEIWHNAQADLESGLNGLPDGLAVAADGTVYSTGPGGVLVLSPEGTLLGRIQIGDDPNGKATANCTIGGPDGKTLYMTSHDTLARINILSGL